MCIALETFRIISPAGGKSSKSAAISGTAQADRWNHHGFNNDAANREVSVRSADGVSVSCSKTSHTKYHKMSSLEHFRIQKKTQIVRSIIHPPTYDNPRSHFSRELAVGTAENQTQHDCSPDGTSKIDRTVICRYLHSPRHPPGDLAKLV